MSKIKQLIELLTDSPHGSIIELDIYPDINHDTYLIDGEFLVDNIAAQCADMLQTNTDTFTSEVFGTNKGCPL